MGNKIRLAIDNRGGEGGKDKMGSLFPTIGHLAIALRNQVGRCLRGKETH